MSARTSVLSSASGFYSWRISWKYVSLSGNFGNREADRLAREAAARSAFNPFSGWVIGDDVFDVDDDGR